MTVAWSADTLRFLYVVAYELKRMQRRGLINMDSEILHRFHVNLAFKYYFQ